MESKQSSSSHKQKHNNPDWSFQEDAISSLVGYFRHEPFSSNLLVIPTGGGKTLTAIRTISRLLDLHLLHSKDKVVWTVHSKFLRAQAEQVLNNQENYVKFKLNKNLPNVIEVRMKDDARKTLAFHFKERYKLLIIDEAHHSAANTYKEFFTYRKLGILGLTATPTRNDDSKLEFQRMAYSITFGELVKRGVIIKPEFITEKTDININFSQGEDIEDFSERFNTDLRNNKIAEYLLKKKDIFRKIIIFVPSNNHVDSLYKTLFSLNQFYGNFYEIGYIYADRRNGKSNDKGIENEDYLNLHKNNKNPSILVNCMMLDEGYDDPSIDTVVMAVPTKSSLFYMQCIGRVVRNPNKGGNAQKAYVIEFVDNLPNFTYRIDNKWLYSDISDYLEPKVVEQEYFNERDLNNKIKILYKKFSVSKEFVDYPRDIGKDEKISLLFLKPTKSEDDKVWLPLLFKSENREIYTKAFNDLSSNISYYGNLNWKVLFFEKLEIPRNDKYFRHYNYQSDFIQTLRRSYQEKLSKKEIKRLVYINFNKIDKKSWWSAFVKYLDQNLFKFFR